MSQHPSLRIDSVGAQHRNVLKRNEKIKKLQADGKWDLSLNSAYRMPKVKSIKVKVKSGATKEEKAAAAAAKSAAPAADAKAGAAKPGAAKPGAAKPAAAAAKPKK